MKKKYNINIYIMRERDSKGRFVKKDSDKVEKKEKKGGRRRDNKGRFI